ncbi:MAG: S-adenosylmethionine:tRNA ribosyltransferase-isomerase, partial [Firmicutes bacterium]|nr:S-adenosylmethionine:tRNA ribosyltransferase-isomerase [Bacillota bacterium]
FRPVRAPVVEQHVMHEEFFTVPAATADAIARARQQGGRVWAVGTTVVRALESAADETGDVRPGSAWTRLFIHPPYRFRVVDVLITNFHLPRSTLLMLVCAFSGTERILSAYREAVARRYRFYSLGDAMLILP